MSKAVQYKGAKAIMQAFDRTEIATWALILGDKQIVGRSAGKSLQESREDLQQLLKELGYSNTTSQYTLAFYEDIKDRRKIRLSVVPDVSYNVVIFDNDDNPSPAFTERRSRDSAIMDRLDDMDARIALLLSPPEEEDDEEEEVGAEPSGLIGAINKFIDNPRVQEALTDKLIFWAEKFFGPANEPSKQITTMGSTGHTPPPITEIPEEQATKIQESIAVLASIDPKLGDNLQKIAQLAASNPQKYFNAIKMLNTFL